MDHIDYQILACLKENSRENATNIGNRINLSTSAVIERIRKMEHSGLIERYTTIINQKIAGRDLMAFINVKLDSPNFYEKFIEQIKANNSVAECYYIAGDFDFLLKVVTASTSKLEEILNYIKAIDGVSLTRTTVVLSENKNEVCLLPEKE